MKGHITDTCTKEERKVTSCVYEYVRRVLHCNAPKLHFSRSLQLPQWPSFRSSLTQRGARGEQTAHSPLVLCRGGGGFLGVTGTLVPQPHDSRLRFLVSVIRNRASLKYSTHGYIRFS